MRARMQQPAPPAVRVVFEEAAAREAELLPWLAALMGGVGVIVLALELCPLSWAQAPYGRYAANSAWWLGPKLPARVAWAFQESWSFFVPLLLLSVSEPRCLASTPNRILLGMFLLHYAYRALVYPMRMRGGKPMPIVICALASAFCLYNGYLQGRCWTALAVRTLSSGWDAVTFALGCVLWLMGWLINLDSDAILRNLRRPGETGYKIPHGGAFRFVSGANYMGEILEWCGYAIAARHSVATVFAFFTFCNTAPRAHHHHHWYREKFLDYPPERRAVIPYLW